MNHSMYETLNTSLVAVQGECTVTGTHVNALETGFVSYKHFWEEDSRRKRGTYTTQHSIFNKGWLLWLPITPAGQRGQIKQFP